MIHGSMNEGDLLSAIDAAKILRLSPDMVRVLARAGKLRPAAQSVRGIRLFRRADVEALLSEREGRSRHEHDVMFYESDEHLVRSLAEFVAAGLGGGAPVVVVATRAHRTALQERLESRGFDVAAACNESRMAMLDADETLAEIMTESRPDPTRFRAVVSRVLDRVTEAAPRGQVRVFGEMVDLLWRRQQPGAAIELERLWNKLGRKRPFTLLCGYGMKSFAHSEHGKHFETICGEHSRVIPTERFAGDANGDPMRVIASLQQRAGALEVEIKRRKRAEAALVEAKAAQERAVLALHRSKARRETKPAR